MVRLRDELDIFTVSSSFFVKLWGDQALPTSSVLKHVRYWSTKNRAILTRKQVVDLQRVIMNTVAFAWRDKDN